MGQHGKRITGEDISRLMALIDSGVAVSVAAKQAGMTRATAIRVREQLGYPIGDNVSELQFDIIKLFHQGVGPTDISRKLGCSRVTVHKHLKRWKETA